MTTATKFVGSVPEFYDRHLGPHIFEAYAADLARRCGALQAGSCLELAAGTGIVSRKLRDALPARARLVVTDLNPPMLDVARAKFSRAEAVEFQPADAMDLPFDAASFDLVTSQFGVLFFPDTIAAFRESLRVLTPGGHLVFNSWGRMDQNPFSEIAHGVGMELFAEDPPGFYKIPFGYPDPAQIRADLDAAGFFDIAVDTLEVSSPVADWAFFARGLVFGNPMAEEIEKRGGVDAETVVDRIADALETRLGRAPTEMPLVALVASARRP